MKDFAVICLLEAPNKIYGVILILKRIIESVPEVYSLLKVCSFVLLQLLLHLESDDSAQLTHVRKKKKQTYMR
ncbi:hypothetical protein Bca4012_051125 [Brassica carinata]